MQRPVGRQHHLLAGGDSNEALNLGAAEEEALDLGAVAEVRGDLLDVLVAAGGAGGACVERVR